MKKFNFTKMLAVLGFVLLIPAFAMASGQELSWLKVQGLVTKAAATISAGDYVAVYDHNVGKVRKVDATAFAGGSGSFATVTATTAVNTPYVLATGTPSATGCTLTALSGGLSTFQFTAGATSCTVAVVLPTAPHGWWCRANDITTPANLINQSVVTATGCTVTGTVSTSDVIIFDAEAY